jgi:selenocysteine lyase/cysteine desulfurase
MKEQVSRRAFLRVLGSGSLLPAIAAGQTFSSANVPAASRELWSWLRAQFVLEPGLAWFDTARLGPVLRAVMAQGFRARERQSENLAGYEAMAASPSAVRERLIAAAAFLGAEPDDLAYTSGAAEGLSTVARGVDLQAGDEVLTTTHDRPAAVYPWLLEAKRRGVKVIQLPQDNVPASPESIVGRFAGAITPRTRVMAFAHVQATDGTVLPVRELCALARGNGIFTVVDGALGPGLLDLRLADIGCDAYAASCHRWVGAAHGSGLLYLRREARTRVWPLVVRSPAGWDTSDRYGIPAAPPGSDGMPEAQAEYGCLGQFQVPGQQGIGLAIELQEAVHRARIGARIRELASYLRQQLATLAGVQILTPTHPSLTSGIVSLRVAGRDHAAMARSMAEEDRVVVGHVAHGPVFDALRISVHPASDFDELERCVNSLRRRI